MYEVLQVEIIRQYLVMLFARVVLGVFLTVFRLNEVRFLSTQV